MYFSNYATFITHNKRDDPLKSAESVAECVWQFKSTEETAAYK